MQTQRDARGSGSHRSRDMVDDERSAARRRRADESRGREDPADEDVGMGAAGPTEAERPPRRPRRPGLTAAGAAQAGLSQITELTGREPQGVVSVQRADQLWRVAVEVIEDRRIPSSTDVLALYEADIDAEGDVLGYRRTRRYARGKGDSGGE